MRLIKRMPQDTHDQLMKMAEAWLELAHSELKSESAAGCTKTAFARPPAVRRHAAMAIEMLAHTAMVRPRELPHRKPQSSQDQQFEDRRRIAKRLVQELREAGYQCGLVDDGHARALKRDD